MSLLYLCVVLVLVIKLPHSTQSIMKFYSGVWSTGWTLRRQHWFGFETYFCHSWELYVLFCCTLIWRAPKLGFRASFDLYAHMLS